MDNSSKPNRNSTLTLPRPFDTTLAFSGLQDRRLVGRANRCNLLVTTLISLKSLLNLILCCLGCTWFQIQSYIYIYNYICGKAQEEQLQHLESLKGSRWFQWKSLETDCEPNRCLMIFGYKKGPTVSNQNTWPCLTSRCKLQKCVWMNVCTIYGCLCRLACVYIYIYI